MIRYFMRDPLRKYKGGNEMVVRVMALLEAMFGKKEVETAQEMMDLDWDTVNDDPDDISRFKRITFEEARRVYAVMVFLEDHEEVM